MHSSLAFYYCFSLIATYSCLMLSAFLLKDFSKWNITRAKHRPCLDSRELDACRSWPERKGMEPFHYFFLTLLMREARTGFSIDEEKIRRKSILLFGIVSFLKVYSPLPGQKKAWNLVRCWHFFFCLLTDTK